MKKLTAGIFATILGVTAMGAADAAVTSKGYVDAAVGAVAGDVSTLSQTVEGHTTQITNLQTASDTHALKSNVYTKSEVNSALDLKADKSLVGTLPEGTNASTVVGYVDEKTKDIASDATVNALSDRVDDLEAASATHATKTELTNGLDLKADKSTTYTITETNNLLNAKANDADLAKVAKTGAYADLDGKPDLSDMATKTEVANTYATKTDITGMATQTWVGEQDYATNTALTTGLSGKQANLSDTQLQAVNSGITAEKISTMDQATADAQADATQALADAATADGKAVAAQAAAEAAQATANAAIKAPAACSDPTNMCVLVSDGTTVSWQVIANVYPDNNGTLN